MVENVADQRQISESRAAHACLLLLIQKHQQLFLAPADMLARCKFNYFEESVPVSYFIIYILVQHIMFVNLKIALLFIH